jgi:hypothetical protein
MTRTHRNALITKNRKWNKHPLYPCWCGASLVKKYRTIDFCCLAYIGSLDRGEVLIVLHEL